MKGNFMSQDGFANEIYNIVGSEPIILYDNEGNVTYEPEMARSFFLSKDKIMIQLTEDPLVLAVSLSDEVNAGEFENTYGERLRKIAINHTAKYSLRTYGKKLTPKDFAENRPVLENLYGSTKSSYQKIGGAKVIVRHSTSVNEEKRGARTRNIKQVFVETHDGERFKIPHQNLHAARAVAYHLNHGGIFQDQVSHRMMEMTDQMEQIKEQHDGEQDSERKFWLRERYLMIREQFKRNYSSQRQYSKFVEHVAPVKLKESVQFENWAKNIAPSDHVLESDMPSKDGIISTYLSKINYASKSEIPNIVNEMVQLGIADKVINHLNWPVKSMVMEFASNINVEKIRQEWGMAVLKIKNQKLSVKDAIKHIATEYSSSSSGYAQVEEMLIKIADEAGLLPKDQNAQMIDDILSKNVKLRTDLQTIKAQEFYGQARFIEESEEADDHIIYNMWLNDMQVIGQGLGHRAATQNTIGQIAAKYKISFEEAEDKLETVLQRHESQMSEALVEQIKSALRGSHLETAIANKFMEAVISSSVTQLREAVKVIFESDGSKYNAICWSDAYDVLIEGK